MNIKERLIGLVPTLKCNNRKRSLDFFRENLGMKVLLEDSAWTALGDSSKLEKLTLEEAPAARTRQVKGSKKLARLVIKVQKPEEIESLLARGSYYSALYKGQQGYAFESLSPEGDRVLLHAEESLADLVPIQSADFQAKADFSGLTAFEVQQVVLHVKSKNISQAFYEQFLQESDVIAFEEAEGADLDLPADVTWDLSQLKFVLTDLDAAAIKASLQEQEVFIPKKGQFVTSQDPSQIELWFEAR